MTPSAATPPQSWSYLRDTPRRKSRKKDEGGHGMGTWLSAVLSNPRVMALGHRDHRALVVAVHRWANDDGTFWTSQGRWAREAGMSTATLKRAIASLEDLGLLSHQRRLRSGAAPKGEGSCVYFLLVGPHCPPTDPQHLATGDEVGSSLMSDPGGPPASQLNRDYGFNSDYEKRGGPASRAHHGSGTNHNSELVQEPPQPPPIPSELRPEHGERPGSLTGELPGEVDRRTAGRLREADDFAAIVRWLGERGGRALSDEELQDLRVSFEADPDDVAAHAREIANTPNVRHPLAVLHGRLCRGDGDYMLEGWTSRITGEHESDGLPRPWALGTTHGLNTPASPVAV